MPLTDSSFEKLLGSLYAGVADESRLSSFLTHLAQLMNAHTGVVQIHDPLNARADVVTCVGAIDVNSNELIKFSRDFAGDNVWVNKGTNLLLRDGMISGADIINPIEMMRTGFYQEFLRKVDIYDSFGALLHQDGSAVAMLTVNCSRRQGLFGADQKALMRQLLPHLQNAYAIQRRLSWLDNERLSLRAALDRLSFGVILLDSSARIRTANVEAERLLSGKLDIGRSFERIIGIDSKSRNLLHNAVLAAAGRASPTSHSARIAFRSTDNPSDHLVAVVAPLHASTFSDFDVSGSRVIVFLHPQRPTRSREVNEKLLIELHGLTPTQAHLARLLCDGKNLEECALELNNRMHTVKTQLKAIYAKTGVRRQAELVAMLGAVLDL
jgi:DNA-binding CsgD family transcriptional regulator